MPLERPSLASLRPSGLRHRGTSPPLPLKFGVAAVTASPGSWIWTGYGTSGPSSSSATRRAPPACLPVLPSSTTLPSKRVGARGASRACHSCRGSSGPRGRGRGGRRSTTCGVGPLALSPYSLRAPMDRPSTTDPRMFGVANTRGSHPCTSVRRRSKMFKTSFYCVVLVKRNRKNTSLPFLNRDSVVLGMYILRPKGQGGDPRGKG